MKDFKAAIQSIPGLARYFQMNEGASGIMKDDSPFNNVLAGHKGTQPAMSAAGQPSYLLDQTRKGLSYCYMAAHGYYLYDRYPLQENGTADSMVNQSWSLVLAGLKAHDMTVQRGWHGFNTATTNATPGSAISNGGSVLIGADGTLTVSGSATSIVNSAAGMILRFTPHIIIVSYDNAAGKITAYVGDWTGRFVTAIPATTASPITAYPTGAYNFIGATPGITIAAADGFLDDFAFYSGHAITSTEAAFLHAQAGYAAPLSYTPTMGHRNAPLQAKYPDTIKRGASSAAEATEISTKSQQTYASGAGGFNYTQFTTGVYTATKAFRSNPANLNPALIVGPYHYGDIPQTMQFEDCPVPYNGRPSLGFAPSTGSDAHCTIYCVETDELWDMGVMTNTGTDVAPAWTPRYGGKVTQCSLLWDAFQSGYLGTTATGILCGIGTPTIPELVAARAGTAPIPHGLHMVMPDGLAQTVWPAQRHDGGRGAGVGYYMAEAQVLKLPSTAAMDATIAAMPHLTGRVIAQAAQTYGMMIIDRNFFAVLFLMEDNYEFYTVNGYDIYHPNTGGVDNVGFLDGQTYAWQTLAGFPWDSFQLLDADAINPTYNGQPRLPAPSITGHQRLSDRVLMAWQDQLLAITYNVYTQVGSVYTLIATTEFPEYTQNPRPASPQTYVVTAVNAGGESLYSAPMTPSAGLVVQELATTSDTVTRPLPTVRSAVRRRLRVRV